MFKLPAFSPPFSLLPLATAGLIGGRSARLLAGAALGVALLSWSGPAQAAWCEGGPLSAALFSAGAESFYFEPHLGTPVAPLEEWGLTPGTEVRLLSDGVPGKSREGNYGRSLLIVPANRAAYVLKVYRWSQAMEEDLYALQTARDWLRGTSGGYQFKVAWATSFGPGTMKIQYQRGRDLAGLLQDRRVPAQLKRRLIVLFQQRIRTLVRAAKESDGSLSFSITAWGPNPEMGEEGRLFVYSDKVMSDQRLNLLLNLNPNQVIVDPITLDMTIVDPI